MRRHGLPLYGLILIMLTASLPLPGVGVPRETIVAEFTGGNITSGELDDRIDKIPPMYQTKYKTEDGKNSLLDMMCTEELFYLEGLAMNIKDSPKFQERIEIQIKTYYAQEFKKNLLVENVTLSREEKYDYFRQHANDIYAGVIFEEVENSIELQLRPKKEEQYYQDYLTLLRQEYEISVYPDVLEQVNLDYPEASRFLYPEKIIDSSSSDIVKNVEFFVTNYTEMPPQQKNSMSTTEGLNKYLADLAEILMLHAEAVKAGYEERPDIRETVQQIERNMVLKTAYNMLVIDEITITDETMNQYYNNNLDKFSTKASRQIQTFHFATRETADQMRKDVKKLLNRNHQNEINRLVEEHSLYTKNNGIIDNIYQNDIIPGIGKDEVYAGHVWKTAAGKTSPDVLSKVFQSQQGDYVFFRILLDNPAQARPFVEIIDRVRDTMIKDLSKQKFDEQTIRLQQKYQLVKYPERLFAVLSSEEYFQLAEEAQKKRRFLDAIYYYDKVIKNYPNNNDDYKATFMKAFLYAEELDKKDLAIEIFQDLLKSYPESDLHESARFMIMELEGKGSIIEKFED